MKEKKERKKIREFLKFIKMNRKAQIVTAVLACGILAGVSITVYSKYYKTGYNPGMAVASGFYFNSNFMAAVSELKGITPEDLESLPSDLIPEEVLESIIVSANTEIWSNGPYTFPVEVRNYDNQLLYNDKDLDVEYEVCFRLLEDPGVAAYSVSFDQETKDLYWDDGQGSVVTFTGTLPGGALSRDTYNLTINLVSDTGETGEYEPADVLMVAYPIGPEFLRNTKSIAGIIRANYQEKEFEIEKQGFTICETNAYVDGEGNVKENWGNVVFDESGYVYQVYTSGTFTGNGAATRKTLLVKWRDDMYQINKFDEYYQAVSGNNPDAVNDRFYYETIDGKQWRVMKIDVLPYSSLKFTFFRQPGFEDGLQEMIDSDAENNNELFEKSVWVEIFE